MLAISLGYDSKYRKTSVLRPWLRFYVACISSCYFLIVSSLIKGFWLFLEWEMHCLSAWRERTFSLCFLPPHDRKDFYAYLFQTKAEKDKKSCYFPCIGLEITFVPVVRSPGPGPQVLHSLPCTMPQLLLYD